MRNFLLLILLLVVAHAPLRLHAQHKVRFVLKENTTIPHDSIYVTGSFNNWDSTHNPAYRLRRMKNNTHSIVLPMKPGRLEYKFHRGSWGTVEKHSFGWEVSNRAVEVKGDTTFTDQVDYWNDQILIEHWLALAKPQHDTARVNLLTSLAAIYGFNMESYNTDSAFFYLQEALHQLQKVKTNKENAFRAGINYYHSLHTLQSFSAQLLHSLGNYSKALELLFDNLKIAVETKQTSKVLFTIGDIISEFDAMKDHQNVLRYTRILEETAATQDHAPNVRRLIRFAILRTRVRAYYNLRKLDSAWKDVPEMKWLASKINHLPIEQTMTDQLLGDLYAAAGHNDSARAFYRQSIDNGLFAKRHPPVALSYAGLAGLLKKEGKTDSALVYAKAAFDLVQNNNFQLQGENQGAYLADLAPLLASLYHADRKPDSAYKYLQLAMKLRDSVYNTDRVRQFQNIAFNESLRRQQHEQEEAAAQQRSRQFYMVTGLGLLLIFFAVVAWLQWRNNRHKQKAFALLQQQKQKTEDAFNQLKATQRQLVQHEKMASLGELTAGIAHEIQNPLNFVNNFSDITGELLDEVQANVKTGDTGEVTALLETAKINVQKIAYHGRRAETIVRGMMEHSRSSQGEKQPTDINLLAQEYLNLAYHGFRVKDKNFTAIIETHFDPLVDKIDADAPELGRVLLNLFSNAFYAMQQKKKSANGNYEPLLQVSTGKKGSNIIISIKDNGTGIPEKSLSKIYQPFFTTKPTGQGTGLGLSLSYDIITKGHGGELAVETKDGEGAEFVVSLPTA